MTATHASHCDGWRTSHRVEIARLESGSYKGICDECGEFYVGSSSMKQTAEALSAGHPQEVPCDGCCVDAGEAAA